MAEIRLRAVVVKPSHIVCGGKIKPVVFADGLNVGYGLCLLCVGMDITKRTSDCNCRRMFAIVFRHLMQGTGVLRKVKDIRNVIVLGFKYFGFQYIRNTHMGFPLPQEIH